MALVIPDARPVDVVDRTTGEVLAEREAGALVVARPAPLSFAEALERLTAPGALEQQQKLMDLYDRACRALVGPNDIQREGDREFKKKSAWRKLGRFFGVSTEIVKIESGWEWDEEEQVRHFVARVIVRGTAPWGQSVEAVGLCSTRELRFYSRGQPNPVARAKAEHDCEATAATRATNRAISDLIAAGEVSAEEIEHEGEPRPSREEMESAERRRANGQTYGSQKTDARPATQKQMNLIEKLVLERQVPEDRLRRLQERIANGPPLTTKEASETINWLSSLPKEEPEAAPVGGPFDDEPDDLPF